MTESELERCALAEVEARVQADGPPQPRVLQVHAEAEWVSELFRRLSVHEFHVLGRGPDLVVFFDDQGKITGWRDDGRRGTEQPAWVDREGFLKAVVGELGLPKATRLGRLEPVELPPLGWTHQAVLFLARIPEENQVLRVWASPENLRVIQCLSGPLPRKEP